MKSALPVLIVLLGAGGCAATPAPPIEYLLQPAPADPAGLTSHTDFAVAIGRVAIAPYLDRDGIVVETADRRLAVARDHRWAEPLQHSLRRLLQTGIAEASGQAVAADAQNARGGAGLVVDVGIQRFHGTEAGRVTLVADWTVRQAAGDRIVGHHQLVRDVLTEADGYDALVRAHLDLAGQLASAIASTVAGAGR